MDVYTDTPVSRLEIVDTGRRRRFTDEAKLRIVAESYSGRRLGSATARKYGITRSQLADWRNAAGVGRFGPVSTEGFVPAVVVAEASSGAESLISSGAGRIEIVSPNGRRVIVDSDVDVSALLRIVRGARDVVTIPLPSGQGVRVWLATGHTDMRCGFPSLALRVQEVLKRDAMGGGLFCFRGKRGDLLKVIWHDGQGACLFTKRLERGRFIWPSVAGEPVTISPAQLSYLLSGIDWRNPQETQRPTRVG